MKKIKSNQKIATIEFCYKSAAIPNVSTYTSEQANRRFWNWNFATCASWSVLERFSRITQTFQSNYSSEYSASVLLFQQNRET